MATDVARLSLAIDVTGAQRARQALEGLRNGSIRATQATQQQAAASTRLRSGLGNLRKSFRLQKGAVQQAGFQFQDFAVQVGAGQSALVAFSQQGSQLAGILGPGGAVLGAVIAIGSALAGAFLAATSSAAESTKTLRERIEELELSYRDLTSAQRASLQLDFAKEERERAKAAKDLQDEIRGASAALDQFNRGVRVRRGPSSLAEDLISPEEALELRERLTNLRAELDTLGQEGEDAANRLDELLFGFETAGEEADEARDSVAEFVDALRVQAETLGFNARQTALYEAERLGANSADLAAVNAAYDKIEAYKQEQQQLKLLREQYKITAAEDPLLQRVDAQDRGQGIIDDIRKEAEAVRMGLDEELSIRQAHKDRVMALNDALRLGIIDSAEERSRLEIESAKQRNEQLRQLEQQKYQVFTSGQESFLNATSNLFGNLASIAEKGGEEQFSTWKAMASAQAAVSTALAVANALTAAPPPINFALAASVGALGAVQIAQIDAQEYQGSFLGGGYTGDGSRTGGVDGRGGFPAILHPNESVIDHEMGGRGQGSNSETNVTQVFQLSDNARREAKQQILESAPMIRSMAKQAVLEAISQGGKMSRAVGRRS